MDNLKNEIWFDLISESFDNKAKIEFTGQEDLKKESIKVTLPCGCILVHHPLVGGHKISENSQSVAAMWFQFCKIHNIDFSAEMDKPIKPIAHSKDRNGIRFGTTQKTYDNKLKKYYHFIKTHEEYE